MAVRVPIYLDNHATTRPDPRVVQAMLPYLEEHYGNASSKQHSFGWTAGAAVDHARRRVARLIGATEREVVFTSGATESVNLALKGLVAARGGSRCHIVTVATEHRAVLDTARALERDGCGLTVLGVDGTGLVSVSDIERALTDETVLVTVMAANNEIGTLAPIEEISARSSVEVDADWQVKKIIEKPLREEILSPYAASIIFIFPPAMRVHRQGGDDHHGLRRARVAAEVVVEGDDALLDDAERGELLGGAGFGQSVGMAASI